MLSPASRAANLSQTELSKKLKMSCSSVSEWLSGKRCPRINVVRQIAKVLGVSVKALTGAQRMENLGTNVPPFQAVPVFQVAAGPLPKVKQLGDIMDRSFSPTLWRCRLCGNHYEFDEMTECPVDGEPCPGTADPVVVTRKRLERLEASARPDRQEIEGKVAGVLDELEAKGVLAPNRRENVKLAVMRRFEAWLNRQESSIGAGA